MSSVSNGSWKVQTKGYSKSEASDVCKDKLIVFIGDSVVRAVYKDMVALIKTGRLLTDRQLRAKGETNFEGDKLVEGGIKEGLFNGKTYIEVREYRTNTHCLRFYFVTRCYYDYMETILQDFLDQPIPDVVYLGSCCWDITRWTDEVKDGPRALHKYKANLEILFTRLREVLPEYCLIIWACSMPLGDKVKGGFMDKQCYGELGNVRRGILEANYFSSDLAVRKELDVIDFHYYFKNFQVARKADGIHWNASASRNMSFMLIHHLCWAWERDDIVAKPENAVQIEAEVDKLNVKWANPSIQGRDQRRSPHRDMDRPRSNHPLKMMENKWRHRADHRTNPYSNPYSASERWSSHNSREHTLSGSSRGEDRRSYQWSDDTRYSERSRSRPSDNGYHRGPDNGYHRRPDNGYHRGPNNDYHHGPNNDYPHGPNNHYPRGPDNGFSLSLQQTQSYGPRDARAPYNNHSIKYDTTWQPIVQGSRGLFSSLNYNATFNMNSQLKDFNGIKWFN